MAVQSSESPKVQLVLKLRQISEAKMMKLKPKLKRKLELMDGVDSVEIDANELTIFIKGSVDPCTILSRLRDFKITVDSFSCERIESIGKIDENGIQGALQESKRSGDLEDEIQTLSRMKGVRKIRVTKIIEVTIDHQVQDGKWGDEEIKNLGPQVSSTSSMKNYNYSNLQRPLWSGGPIPSAPPIPSDYAWSPIRSPPPVLPPPILHPAPSPPVMGYYSNTTILSDHYTNDCRIL